MFLLSLQGLDGFQNNPRAKAARLREACSVALHLPVGQGKGGSWSINKTRLLVKPGNRFCSGRTDRGARAGLDPGLRGSAWSTGSAGRGGAQQSQRAKVCTEMASVGAARGWSRG